MRVSRGGGTLPAVWSPGGDGSREVFTRDFRRQPPPSALLGITAQAWHAAIHQAPDFAALVAQFPATGWRFDAGTDAGGRQRPCEAVSSSPRP